MSGRSSIVPTRSQILEALSALVPVHFEKVIFLSGVQPAMLTPTTLPQAERAMDLIKHFESRQGGLIPLVGLIEKVNKGVLARMQTQPCDGPVARTWRGSVTLFICHSNADATLCSELQSHLALLKRSGLIEAWSAGQLLGGERREEVIAQQMARADVVLLLVSASFMADVGSAIVDPHGEPTNQEELAGLTMQLRRALRRQRAKEALVTPIIVRATDWAGSALGRLTPLPSGGRPIVQWDDRDAAWLDVVEGLRAAIVQWAER